MRLIVSVASSVCSVDSTSDRFRRRGGPVSIVSKSAHFADENDIGILPQRASQRLGERPGIHGDSRWLMIDLWSRWRNRSGLDVNDMTAAH